MNPQTTLTGNEYSSEHLATNRRVFFHQATAGLLAAGVCPWGLQAEEGKERRILLASAWHDINIGDIAHTPGMLRLIEQHLPEVSVTLWPCPTTRPGYHRKLDPAVRQMLLAGFPKLRIIEEGYGELRNGRATRPDLVAAIDQADLLVVGSGGMHNTPAAIWRDTTDKPFGAYGVTIGGVRANLHGRASFLYTRDAQSLKHLQDANLEGTDIDFAPDATFALHLRDDQRAERYLAQAGLERKKFLCVIPRLRNSPYHEIYNYEPTERDREIDRINAEHQGPDHAILRDLITHWVRETGLKVLACPEMTYGVPLAKAELVDPLPEDVRKQVVWRDSFWLADEAASVFAQARAMVSLDCHSPIIALVGGTPAIHLRLASDNPHKSQMFAQIGLPDWIHDHSDISAEKLISLVMEIHASPEAAQQRVDKAMAYVRGCHGATLGRIRQKHFS